ncbi:MAG: uL15 family ribosomal protein [Clostridia bacterium]|nr:uL15 family ribosomal protein [Clostridia bacterium]
MESNKKQSKGFLKTALFIALLLLVAALVFVIIRPYKVSYACLIAAAVLCVVILILLLIGRKKPAMDQAEPAPAPANEPAPEEEPAEVEAEAEEEPVEEAAEEAEPVADGEGMGLKESLNIAAHAHRAEKMSKAYVSGYLRSVYSDKIELNERGNATATGLPLADTHYVTAKDGKKVCFVYVYETDGATMLLLKTKDALGKEMTKEHHSVRRSAFPKAKDAWYSVVVDDSLSNEQVEDMLDRTIALYTGEPIPKKVPAEAIGLKETLDIAAHAHRIEELTKPSIAQYLKKVYPTVVETNEREHFTKTGLPLADTHYVTAKDGKQLCFVYVYETAGALMLILKTKDTLGREMMNLHHSVRRSAFPKAKDAWYSVVVDDSLSNAQVEEMLDRTIALYTGGPIPQKTKHIVAPVHTVSHVTLAEAEAIVTDEQAEAAIEEDATAPEHTGKKGIVNVDTLSNSFDEGDVVTIAKLKEKNLIPANIGQVKLLARGTLNKLLHVELQDFSLEAVKMVVATGGTVKRV